MDSLSHTAMGAGIAAVVIEVGQKTQFVPEIDNNWKWIIYLALAIVSFGPDFDVIFRVKGQDKFLAIHRAKSHSIFSIILFSAIAAGIMQFVAVIPWNFFWTFGVFYIAMLLHVVMDIFNNYGTQALWPINKKWYALSYTNTADSIIHALHFVAFIIFFVLGFNNHAIIIFSIVNGLIWGYLLVLFFVRKGLKKKLREMYGPDILRMAIISKTLPHKFKYIIEKKESYKIGFIDGRKITERDTKVKDKRLPENYYQIIKKDIGHKNFTNFSPIHYWAEEKNGDGDVRIKYTDLRYIDANGHYSFNLVYDFKEDMTYTRHVGWVFNQPALDRKLTRKNSAFSKIIRGSKND